MNPGATQVQFVHNSACETAAMASCHCFCHGAGHQSDLVVRAASCGTTADRASLANNLDTIFGGFHSSFRDISTPTRKARNILSASDAASLGHQKGRGATWFETLVVDETLHSMFLTVADSSLAMSAKQQGERKDFVERVTGGAVPVIGSATTVSNIVESHVWCSIVAEYLAGLTPLNPGEKLPPLYDLICYPRLSGGRRPAALGGVQSAGLHHLQSASASTPVPAADQLDLLRLVAAATCPDLWHHPAVVRFSLEPIVLSTSWPRPGSTTIATANQFKQLRRRWQLKKHW